jgi:hypothetical protein
MKCYVSLRAKLARFVEQRDIAGATNLLHGHVEDLIERSEQRPLGCASRNHFDDRVRLLIEAVSAIPDLVEAEGHIAGELEKIKVLDNKLLFSAEQLREHIANCAAVGERLLQVGWPYDAPFPHQPGRSKRYPADPLYYLKSFARPRPATAYREHFREGRPWLHPVIETESYDDRLVLDIAVNSTWRQYFMDCLRFFRERYQNLQRQLPVRDLLKISKEVASQEIFGFRDEKFISLLDPIRQIYLEREKVKTAIDEQLEQINHFYACLKPCERVLFLYPLQLPPRKLGYEGKPLIGNFPRQTTTESAERWVTWDPVHPEQM